MFRIVVDLSDEKEVFEWNGILAEDGIMVILFVITE